MEMKQGARQTGSVELSVLIVESDKQISNEMRTVLKKAGYSTLCAASGKQAIDKILKHPELLLLLNFKLPDMDGIKFLKKLKENNLKVPFIVMIESHAEKQAAQMIHKGALEYVIKEDGYLDILPSILEKTLHELKLEKDFKKLQDDLKLSKQKYDIVFENSNTPMAITDHKGIFLMVNNAFVRLCGMSKKEVECRKSWKDLVFYEDKKKIKTPHKLESTSPNISLSNYEFRLVDKHQRVRDIFLTVSMIPGESWEIASFLDISAMRDVEKALEQSERQFQNLVKSIPGIVYLCSYDEHWTMHYIVKAIEDITGYPASDFINNNVRSYASIIHPDDLSLVESTILEAIEKNEPYEIEYRIIKKDGKIVWVYEKGQKVYTQNERIWLNGIIFDITERKQIAIALDIATQEWQVTFDAMPNAVFLLNRECRIMKCNSAAGALLDKFQGDIIGKRYCEVINNISEPREDSLFCQMLKSGKQQTEVRSWSGKVFECTIVPIISSEGDIYGSVLLIVDITKLKTAERKLKDKNRLLKSIFHTAPIGLGVVSHRELLDVNEEMCKITGYSKEEHLGRTTRFLYPDEKHFRQVGLEYEAKTGEEVAVIKTKFKRKDGRIIDILLHITPANTEIKGFTFTAINLSDNELLHF
jgi:PAS domain S-box-containing protein